MFVHANIATVPAFAPRHEYADWYWGFLETKPDIVLHPTCPMPEIVAWHREHYGEQRSTTSSPTSRSSASTPTTTRSCSTTPGCATSSTSPSTTTASAGGTRRTLRATRCGSGRRRDVVAELAAAVRARGHQFGCYYSLLDWSHADYPDPQRYVDDFMRPQIRELVERFEPALLWGDGHWGHPGGHWRADMIVDETRAYARGTRVRARVQRPLLRVRSRLRHLRVRRPRQSARPTVGGVPRARPLVLRESQRDRGRLPAPVRDRRHARGDGRQGRQLPAQRRAGRRRPRPRRTGEPPAGVGRVDPRPRSGDPRVDGVRRAGLGRALVHAHGRRRARVRPFVRAGTVLRGVDGRHRGDDAGGRGVAVPGDGRGPRRRRAARSTGTRSGRATACRSWPAPSRSGSVPRSRRKGSSARGSRTPRPET